jgi:hypothetical protein
VTGVQTCALPFLKQGAEGIEFSLRVFASAKKALFVKEYFNHYRYNENSISKKVDEKNTQYLTDCYQEINKFISKLPQTKYFKSAFTQRVLYTLIAITLSTYFHASNNDSFRTKVEKFKKVLNNGIFREALHEGDFSKFDISRRITLYAIQMRLYFLLPIISNLKYFLIRRGMYSY